MTSMLAQEGIIPDDISADDMSCSVSPLHWLFMAMA
jgi:hypothetical protein